MDLDAQIEDLKGNAPAAGVAVDAISAIAPTLKAIAQKLKHEQYYVLQTLEQGWVMTTLNNRTQPEAKKNVVYAHPTLKDAAAGPVSVKDPQVMALPVPVIRILFQMLALKPIDSIIFMETSGKQGQGIEIRRQDIQALVQAQLQQAQPGNPPPTDIA
jgi:hypothetical protein